eukprot:gb/GEZN01001548.1/.p1 GENE.gb/GEZN01001548.1/~~gb/GEZN01001548.1/.p1  ORF type:complete len:907 (-),score=48.80 gb/GEZN01001548.1/:65-2785(-)
MHFAPCLVLALALVGVNGDFFLQWPRGSNNRLDGQSRERENGRRLFDSENNGRGGYNRGTGRFYWYENSVVPFVWTQDQSCNDPSKKCTYVIQYYCHEHLRDGWYTDSTSFNTIPYEEQSICRVDFRRKGWVNGNCTYDYRYGMQETKEYYDECRMRSRNKGLFTANQRLNQAAIYTRMNPGGTRFGYECPEERDYYPYWNPSPWRDLVILTDEPERCAAFQEASQNVKDRWVCVFSEEMHKYAADRRWSGYVPITLDQCERPLPLASCGPGGTAGSAGIAGCVVIDSKGNTLNLGVWTRVDKHGIPAPLCQRPAFHERPNYLSNPIDNFGFEAGYNWTIPSWFVNQYQNEIDPERCAIRIRHNVTSGGDPGFKDHGYKAPDSIEAGKTDWKMNSVDENGGLKGSFWEYPTQIPVWEEWGITQAEVNDSFVKAKFTAGKYGRGYVFGDQPKVDIFGSLLGGTNKVYLNVAINTQNWPRTFQDRTHGFAIRRRPVALEGVDIVNLSVKGKRGNIVQTWPAHEYDFHPSPLEIKSGSFIHIQWNGANTNPKNNAGEGPQGFDRSNIVVLGEQLYTEPTKINPATGEAMLTYGQLGRSYPQHFGYNPLNTQTPSKKEGQEKGRFLQFEWLDDYVLSYPPLMSGYFDFGLKQVHATVATTYNYLCTRNNNFSNRSQKGQITILPRTEADGPEALISLPSRDALLSIPGVAYISYDRDERLRYQQAIELTQSERMEGFASPWIKVWPRMISMPDMKGTIQLNMYYDYTPLHFGRIYWAEKPDPTHYDLIQMNTQSQDFSWGDTARASVWINQGGYFVVKNDMNWSAMGGIIVGLSLTAVISFFLYKKFGCRFVGGTKFEGARDPLISDGKGKKAPRSDDPAPKTNAAASTAIPLTTTSGETALPTDTSHQV